MWKEIKLHQHFFRGYGIFLLLSIAALILFKKSDIHLFINQFHLPLTDVFFKYITHLGDGWMVFIVAILALFISIRFSILLVVSGMLSGVITQVLKKVIFAPTARPYAYFDDVNTHMLHLIDGVEMHSAFSFPSGHSTAVFCVLTAFSLSNKFSKLDQFFIISAIIIAFSRVYLSQHFLIDIVAGSVIGVFTSVACYIWLYKSKSLSNKPWDTPLFFS